MSKSYTFVDLSNCASNLIKLFFTISGWHSSLATQKNKNNIVVTIHSPDKTRIRSRHALLTYCTENNVDISEFGDLRFFYNPNYLPAVEPHAMERSLKRLEMVIDLNSV